MSGCVFYPKIQYCIVISRKLIICTNNL